jgi:hypothetical protein
MMFEEQEVYEAFYLAAKSVREQGDLVPYDTLADEDRLLISSLTTELNELLSQKSTGVSTSTTH